ncbi:RICIN domain-containing protein [Actinoplanes sp. CA-015351]|uniref:RICIN domain-containing protein n=1 Tax=Actinoplanes sp. CA-015351 TaxID=3239897 RepID=UPI003D97C115
MAAIISAGSSGMPAAVISTWVNQNSGKCLDVVGSGTTDGTDIQQFACGSGANQQWSRAAA